jgi:hypothetical protein
VSYACPSCGTTNITPATRESGREYQVGPSFAHYKGTEKETFEVMKCLDCGKTFQESDALYVEENEENEDESEQYEDEES